MITGTARFAKSACAACRPSVPGILTSRKTRSGRSRRTRSRARVPSAASPTTLYPFSSRSARNPRRIIASSSAMRTRSGSGMEFDFGDGDDRARSGSSAERQRATQILCDERVDDLQAQVAALPRVEPLGQSLPIVFDLKHQSGVLRGDPDLNLPLGALPKRVL